MRVRIYNVRKLGEALFFAPMQAEALHRLPRSDSGAAAELPAAVIELVGAWSYLPEHKAIEAELGRGPLVLWSPQATGPTVPAILFSRSVPPPRAGENHAAASRCPGTQSPRSVDEIVDSLKLESSRLQALLRLLLRGMRIFYTGPFGTGDGRRIWAGPDARFVTIQPGAAKGDLYITLYGAPTKFTIPRGIELKPALKGSSGFRLGDPGLIRAALELIRHSMSLRRDRDATGDRRG